VRPVPVVLSAREHPHPEVRPSVPEGEPEAQVADRPLVVATDRRAEAAARLSAAAAHLSAGAAEQPGDALGREEPADRRRQGDQPGPAVPPLLPVAREDRASRGRLAGAVNPERGAMQEPAATRGQAHPTPARRAHRGPAASSTPRTASEALAMASPINCGSLEDPDP